MNTTAIAEALGVSRQRVHQIVDEDRTFPSPITVLGRSMVWEQEAIERWASAGPRARCILSNGKVRFYTLTGELDTGTVWVPVSDGATDSTLAWITEDLRLPGSPRNGSTGPAIFRVPRWEWARRIADNGKAFETVLPWVRFQLGNKEMAVVFLDELHSVAPERFDLGAEVEFCSLDDRRLLGHVMSVDQHLARVAVSRENL